MRVSTPSHLCLTDAPASFPLLPPYAQRALDILEQEGFEAWIVGGYVRDAFLKQPCTDVDIATNATWRDMKRIFENRGYLSHETGTAHGTLTVIVDDKPLEITTYRSDGIYTDARHPQQVTFVRTIEEDLARRDFTVNALAYHPARGILDPYGGVGDLQSATIRAVGKPALRFAEDALRVLRACRFASQLGFTIESHTFQGMLANKNLLTHISTERITHELTLMLLGNFAGRTLVQTVDVLAAVLPELVAMKGFEQHTPYHIYDVLEHTAHVLDQVPARPLLRWAALFHDMGKPAAFFTDENGTGHFYGHAALSVMLARNVMTRLAFPSIFSTRVLKLIEHHDDNIDPTPKAVKHALMNMNGDTELFAALCALKRSDARGQAPHCLHRIETINAVEDIMEDILSSGDAFSRKQLALNGRDIMALGVAQGPLVGMALSAALEAVVDENVPNDSAALTAFITKWLAQKNPPSP